MKAYSKPTQDDVERRSPKDVVDRVLLVNVREFVPRVITRFSPDGKPAIRIDIASIETGKVLKDQMWLNGAIVDGLKADIGEVIAVKLGYKTSNGGNRYIAPIELTEAELEKAIKFNELNPDIFADDLTNDEAVKASFPDESPW